MTTLRQSVAGLTEQIAPGLGSKYRRHDLGIKRDGISTPIGSRFPSQEDLIDPNAHSRLFFVVADDNAINRKIGVKAIKDKSKSLGHEAVVIEAHDQLAILDAIYNRAMKVGKLMHGVLTDCEMPSKRLPGNSDGGIAYFDEMDKHPWMRPLIESMTTTRKDVGPESSTIKRSTGTIQRLFGWRNEHLDKEKKIKLSAEQLVQSAITLVALGRKTDITPPSIQPKRSEESLMKSSMYSATAPLGHSKSRSLSVDLKSTKSDSALRNTFDLDNDNRPFLSRHMT